MRMTPQRKVILEEIAKLKSHPTAGELCRVVRKRLPRISLGTVYRNLDILSQAGLINRLEVAGLERRFDGDTSRHYHVRCTSCGKLSDLELGPLAFLEAEAAQASDFQIMGHSLEFRGICPQCRAQAEASSVKH